MCVCRFWKKITSPYKQRTKLKRMKIHEKQVFKSSITAIKKQFEDKRIVSDLPADKSNRCHRDRDEDPCCWPPAPMAVTSCLGTLSQRKLSSNKYTLKEFRQNPINTTSFAIFEWDLKMYLSCKDLFQLLSFSLCRHELSQR